MRKSLYGLFYSAVQLHFTIDLNDYYNEIEQSDQVFRERIQYFCTSLFIERRTEEARNEIKVLSNARVHTRPVPHNYENDDAYDVNYYQMFVAIENLCERRDRLESALLQMLENKLHIDGRTKF